jgi:hypothetical protein
LERYLSWDKRAQGEAEWQRAKKNKVSACCLHKSKQQQSLLSCLVLQIYFLHPSITS